MAPMKRLILSGLTACLLLAGAALPAMAQSSGVSRFTENPDADRARVVRKPAGLPGARGTQTGNVAPAERAPTDMRPTEALFDAINRGDTAAARDAVGRGAELDGRNILGLTPLELAIDLGRNDITFLLLSMRGASSAAAPPARATTVAAPPRPAPPRVAAPASAPIPAAPRQRNAGAVGTPVPQAGFLGFGGGTAIR